MDNFKSQLKKSLSKYSKDEFIDNYVKNEFLSKNGDANIYLKIKNKDEIFDSRTINNQLDLKSSFYSFIEEKTDMLENDVKINLHIIGYKFSEEEQKLIKNMIKEHYGIDLYLAQKEYKEKRNKMIYMFLTGLMCVVAYLLIYLKTDFEFFLEVFGLIFSFSLWEACDIYIYELSDIKDEREEVCQNLLMNVYFDNDLKEDTK